MMIFSLVVMIGLEKCCITSACLQWLCHSGERTVACGPFVQSWPGMQDSKKSTTVIKTKKYNKAQTDKNEKLTLEV